jgi:hypothetical protein
LPTVSNDAEDKHLMHLVSQQCPAAISSFAVGFVNDVLVPVNGRDNRARFHWADGATAESRSFTRWAPGEPNNAGGNEGCVITSDKGWNDVPCHTIISCVVCEFYEPRPQWGTISDIIDPAKGVYLSAGNTWRDSVCTVYDGKLVRVCNLAIALTSWEAGTATLHNWLSLSPMPSLSNNSTCKTCFKKLVSKRKHTVHF